MFPFDSASHRVSGTVGRKARSSPPVFVNRLGSRQIGGADIVTSSAETATENGALNAHAAVFSTDAGVTR